MPRRRKELPCHRAMARRVREAMDPFDRASADLADKVALYMRQRMPPR